MQGTIADPASLGNSTPTPLHSPLGSSIDNPKSHSTRAIPYPSRLGLSARMDKVESGNLDRSGEARWPDVTLLFRSLVPMW